MTRSHNTICNVTIGVGNTDLSLIRTFYEEVFGWTFTFDSIFLLTFTDGNIEGAFTRMQEVSGGKVLGIHSDDIEQTKIRIVEGGGLIVDDIHTFPGGSHLSFKDPSGTEHVVYSNS